MGYSNSVDPTAIQTIPYDTRADSTGRICLIYTQTYSRDPRDVIKVPSFTEPFLLPLFGIRLIK